MIWSEGRRDSGYEVTRGLVCLWSRPLESGGNSIGGRPRRLWKRKTRMTMDGINEDGTKLQTYGPYNEQSRRVPRLCLLGQQDGIPLA